MSSREAEMLLIGQVRRGDADAWSDLIARYEGRLLAFVEVRLRNRAASEDVVQETFLGFLNSLPNYDSSQPLESYLFSIAAHKLTDYLRREGRRPTLPLMPGAASESWQPASPARGASSLMRSGERHAWESQSLITALRQQIDRMRERGDWTKLKCLELLFVRGWGNKQAAEELELTEQQVANFKSDFLQRLKQLVRQQNLPLEIFPELHATPDAP